MMVPISRTRFAVGAMAAKKRPMKKNAGFDRR